MRVSMHIKKLVKKEHLYSLYIFSFCLRLYARVHNHANQFRFLQVHVHMKDVSFMPTWHNGSTELFACYCCC